MEMHMNNERERIKILDIYVDNLTMKETVSLVRDYIENNFFLHLMGVNADKILACIDNEEMKNIVNSCGIINADGASVVMASKFLSKKLPERVAGIDLMQELVKDAEINGHTVYFLGAKQEVVEKTVLEMKKKHPLLNVVGYRNGYFFEESWQEISLSLKQLAPDYIFVGITSPLKEYLIEYFYKSGNKGVFMGVGGSFDVISGFIPRAPRWMQNSGLEWLFRIVQEPKRLFRRYFKGNTRFIWLVIKERLKKDIKNDSKR